MCTAVTSAAHKLSGVSAVPSAHIPASFGRELSCKPGNRHALKWLSWRPGHKVLAAPSTGLTLPPSGPSPPAGGLWAGWVSPRPAAGVEGSCPLFPVQMVGASQGGLGGGLGVGARRVGRGRGPRQGGPQGAAAGHGKNARRPRAMLHA